jgi:hypothetical protein
MRSLSLTLAVGDAALASSDECEVGFVVLPWIALAE